jgi:hypothetical protein
MSNRLRAVTLVLGLSAVLLTAFFGTAAIGAQKHQAPRAAGTTKTCSTAGLRFASKSEGVTYSVAVANLKAKGAECSTARSLATVVAKDLLHETKVPARISGFEVTVKAPCAGCTPNTAVTAKSGQELVTFTIKGGAWR